MPTLRVRMHLYRLETLTPPKPHPDGRSRPVGEQDHEHLMRWCRELAAGAAAEIEKGPKKP
ncbi:MAG TPA: hypothetical protein VLG91_02130 [Streptomyces sp.]|nr:hypothetical protein [Streptomyces sp.]